MKFRFHGLAALLAAACLTSCFGIDNQLGEDYIATNQKYDIHSVEFALEDIELASPDSLSGYSTYRFTVGAIRDPEFGLTTRSAAFTLVPVADTLDFGKNAKFRAFHFTAPSDSISCDNLDQEYILQNIHVYALEEELDLTAIAPKIVPSKERITKGVPVYNGSDSLSFDFTRAFGEKYMQITQADLDDISVYRKKFPGIYITTDAPAGNGGRINMFRVPIEVTNGLIYGSYANLKFTADYGTRTQVDTSFLFYIGPLSKYDLSGVTSTSVNDNPQVAYDVITHETKSREGKVTGDIVFEGGRGLKPVVKAAAIKEKLSALISQHGDPASIIVSKATIELPFEFPEDYLDMRLFPTTLSPTCRIVTDTSVSFMGLTDASDSYENQGDINRSRLVYAPDITYHVQELVKMSDDNEKLLNGSYDIWLLIMHNDQITTTTTGNQDMSDYYNYLAYQSYMGSMYGGGYGGYGYGGYGDYYSNYYNYALMAQYYGSSSTSTSTSAQLDSHRYYFLKLYGPQAADESKRPTFKFTYSVPNK